MNPSRRGFLIAGASLITAPAIVRVENLMKLPERRLIAPALFCMTRDTFRVPLFYIEIAPESWVKDRFLGNVDAVCISDSICAPNAKRWTRSVPD